MSVPEGRMRLMFERQELCDLQRTLHLALSDYPYPGESLSQRIRPLLLKVNLYLEATDGPTPHTVRPYAQAEEGLG